MNFEAKGLAPIESCDGDVRVRLLMPTGKFWNDFCASSEVTDGKNDPYDRYSKRIIRPIADELNLDVAFPSDGPPYPPFIRWAQNAPQIHQSPIGMFVHHKFGLWVSFRAALIGGIPQIEASVPSPCVGCAAFCQTACPVGAFVTGQYDVAKCRAHLRSGKVECWQGCLARRACPATKIQRAHSQSNFHMEAFVK